MYLKVNKYYKSNSPDASGLNLEEMEQITEEIRTMIVGPRGLSLPEYIESASKIPLIQLGHRRIYSIKNEPKLEAYFPSEVWAVLKKRCDEVKYYKLTEEDAQFISDNCGRGYEWLSKKLYMCKSSLSRKAGQLGIKINPKHFHFTPSMMEFIKKNVYKGATWLSEQLGCLSDSIRYKCDVEGISLFVKKLHYYTPEEDEFIKQNAQNGSRWISGKLNTRKRSIVDRASRLGVKLAIIQNESSVKYFTPEENSFIFNHLSKGPMWIAKKLNRKVKSVVGRAKLKGWKLARVRMHRYTKQEDQFIRDNCKLGVEYIAEKIGVLPDSLQKHVKNKLGLRIKYSPSEKPKQ